MTKPLWTIDLPAAQTAIFEATGNPLDAWIALAAHDMASPLPPALASYIKGVAQKIATIAGAHHDRQVEAPEAALLAARALELTGTSFNLAEKDNDAAWTASGHRFLGGGAKATKALIHERRPKTQKEIETARKSIERALKRSKASGRTIDD